MSTIKNDVEQFLGRLGISSKSLHRIRFGGVVGKQALVAVFVILGLAVVSRQTTEPNVLRLCSFGILGIGIFAIVTIAIHGYKHPLEATLEGGEVIAYQHVQQEFAAKGTKEITASSHPVMEGLGQKPIEAIGAGSAEAKALNSGTKGEFR